MSQYRGLSCHSLISFFPTNKSHERNSNINIFVFMNIVHLLFILLSFCIVVLHVNVCHLLLQTLNICPVFPPLQGHDGDPCLRSSDCSDGYCCARHFWTKICKPVLRQGEVCTKQRKKGSHGLEIFQRCDCAKGLSCKVWKDATSSSKSRLHMCQKIWKP